MRRMPPRTERRTAPKRKTAPRGAVFRCGRSDFSRDASAPEFKSIAAEAAPAKNAALRVTFQFGQALRRAHIGPHTAEVAAAYRIVRHRRAQQRGQLETRRRFRVAHHLAPTLQKLRAIDADAAE